MLAQRMVEEAATAWLSSLEPGSGPRGLRVLGARGARPLALHPTEQGGLPRAEMGPPQQRHAHRLLASGLSRPGYAVAATAASSCLALFAGGRIASVAWRQRDRQGSRR